MPTVEFRRNLTVSAPLERAWETITDPQRVAGWVEVIDDVEEVEPLARYRGVLADRLGPFRLAADLELTVVDLQSPTHIVFRAEGEDRQVASRIRIEASLTLKESPAGTDVDLDGSYEVTGRVATLGAPMIRSKGEKILDEFVAAARKELG